jgi:uncharacterized protein
MYSIFCLGMVMILDAFDVPVPNWISPVITIAVIGFFFVKSVLKNRREAKG